MAPCSGPSGRGRLLVALVALAASAARARPQSDPLSGFIYALSDNGTTNEWNFIAADLLTFEIEPRGGPMANVEAIGQAAVVLDGVFYSMLLQRGDAEGFVLAGINTSSGERVATFDTRAWPGATGRGVLIEALFAQAQRPGQLLAIGRSLGQAAQLLLDVDAATGNATLRGSVNCSGGDIAYDEARDLLYERVSDGNDDVDSGELVVISAAAAAPGPRVVGTLALGNFFGFPMYDPQTDSLVGLALQTGGPNGYMRNFTTLALPITNSSDYATDATSHGDLGAQYVVLEDGPKAIDPVTRRAFFMLASGPFAEFEIVAVDIDSVPTKVIEAPGICGFIGYCPQAWAFGPSS